MHIPIKTNAVLVLPFLVSGPVGFEVVSSFTFPTFSASNRKEATSVPFTESRILPQFLLRAKKSLISSDDVKSKRRPAPNKYVALKWVIESVQKNGGSPELVDALQVMQQSRTKESKAIAEKRLRSLDLSKESLLVRERVIKACASCGLVTFSVSLLKSILKPVNGIHDSATTLPSSLAYGAVLNSLRKKGEIDKMKEILDDLVQISKKDIGTGRKSNRTSTINEGSSAIEKNDLLANETVTSGVDVVAFNSYLAALCDNILSPHDKRQMIKGRRQSSGDKNRVHTSDNYLNEALALIIDPSSTREKFCLESDLDLFSFNTVLAAAAKAGDHDAVKAIYEIFKEKQRKDDTLVEDIFTYNALLRDAVQKNDQDRNLRYEYEAHSTIISDFHNSTQEKSAIELFDEILANPNVKPDRYTLDLALLPLIQNGRIGDLIEALTSYLENCGARERDLRETSDAFAAFLFTLVKGDELSIAHSVLKNFLLGGKILKKSKSIPVTAKHFNILIEGYRCELENENLKVALLSRGTDDSSIDQNKLSECKLQGQELFDTMIRSKIRPDAYTMTSMLGLQTTSSDITKLWRLFVEEFNVQMTPPVYHALIGAYGKANDPAMAFCVFDSMVLGNVKGKPIRRVLRSWNAIQAVFADELNSSSRLNFEDTFECDQIFSIIVKNENKINKEKNSTPIIMKKLVDGLTCTEASLKLLSMMNGTKDKDSEKIPHPNSQTYCYAATSLSHSQNPNKSMALALFRESQKNSIPADGRFVNAVIRCYGSDIDAAILSWKQEIGQAVTKYNEARRERSQNQNLIAAYHGLFNVCGQAGRPDIAVRLVYAMGRKGLVVNETALQSYEAGKRKTEFKSSKNQNEGGEIKPQRNLQKGMAAMYESILVVECSKYEETDTRRSGEKRVRIII